MVCSATIREYFLSATTRPEGLDQLKDITRQRPRHRGRAETAVLGRLFFRRRQDYCALAKYSYRFSLSLCARCPLAIVFGGGQGYIVGRANSITEIPGKIPTWL